MIKYHHWQDYMENQRLPSEIHQNIAETWRVSKNYGIPYKDPYNDKSLEKRKLKKLLSSHKDDFPLIEECMKNIAQGINNHQKQGYAIMLLDQEGYLLHHIKSFTEEEGNILGLTLGENWSLNTKGTTAMALAYRNKEFSQIEAFQHYQQRYHHYTTTAIAIQDAHGKILYVLGTLLSSPQYLQTVKALMEMATKLIEREVFINERNIIEIREEKIKQQKRLFHNVTNVLGIAVAVITNPEHIFEYVNDEYLELVSGIMNKKLSYKEIIGKSIYEILPINHRYLTEKEIEEIVKDPMITKNKIIFVEGSQEKAQYFQMIYKLIHFNEDSKTHIFIALMDITPQVKLQKDTEALTKEKEEYFATISHELRSPITVIHSAIQMLNCDYYTNQLSEGTKRLIKKIEKNNQRLLRLVNNFLDITKSEAGFIKVNLVNINLASYTDYIVESILPIAEKKKIEIVFTYDSDFMTVALDVEKYERILLNLLSNAIKFTKEKGHIEVYIKAEEDYYRIGVKDNGIGIPEHEIEHIFHRFYMSSNNYKRENQGTGIGLSLVKSFVELMEGKIVVRSKEGKGSEFIVYFPKRLTEEEVHISEDYKNQLSEKLMLEFSPMQD